MGFDGNGEVGGEEVPSPSPPLSYAGTSSAVSRKEVEAPSVHRPGDLVHAIVPELEFAPFDEHAITACLARAITGLSLVKEAHAATLIRAFPSASGKMTDSFSESASLSR
jgi:hypothetical protein